VRHLSLNREGCRLVQEALSLGPPFEMTDVRRRIQEELEGHVREMCASPHGNHVIQRVIEKLPSDNIGWIIQELSGHGEEVARHRYGCRILCRLLERANAKEGRDPLPAEALAGLVDEVLVRVSSMCRQTFGHHVVESVLQNGREEEPKRRVYLALREDLQLCVEDRHASFVVQAALSKCLRDDVEALAEDLIGMLPAIGMTRFGSYVFHSMCSGQQDDGTPVSWKVDMRARALGALREQAEPLKQNTHGQRLLERMGIASKAELGAHELQVQ
jgi:hypothetical protein